jgi:hypothetical protein
MGMLLMWLLVPTASLRAVTLPSQLTSAAHYRCVKLPVDSLFRFEPVDCAKCTPIVLSCVNCECGGEK